MLGCNFNINSFLEAKKLLEGVGLIKTYEKEQDYLIVLYSTKSPKEYFKDIVLKGLLLQAIGKEKFEKNMGKMFAGIKTLPTFAPHLKRCWSQRKCG